MNLPRVLKQTVERALAFEPEQNLGGSSPSHLLVVKPWAQDLQALGFQVPRL